VGTRARSIAFIVLTFAGVARQYTLQLAQSHDDTVKQLVQSSLTANYVGGYIEYVATLVLMVGLLLVARLLRGTGETADDAGAGRVRPSSWRLPDVRAARSSLERRASASHHLGYAGVRRRYRRQLVSVPCRAP
jgi:hypothetical protein